MCTLAVVDAFAVTVTYAVVDVVAVAWFVIYTRPSTTSVCVCVTVLVDDDDDDFWVDAAVDVDDDFDVDAYAVIAYEYD